MNINEISKLVKKIREVGGYSQESLAYKIRDVLKNKFNIDKRISVQTVYRWENKKVQSIDPLYLIALKWLYDNTFRHEVNVINEILSFEVHNEDNKVKIEAICKLFDGRIVTILPKKLDNNYFTISKGGLINNFINEGFTCKYYKNEKDYRKKGESCTIKIT